MNLSASTIALAFLVTFGPGGTQALSKLPVYQLSVPAPQSQTIAVAKVAPLPQTTAASTVRDQVESYFSDIPIMVAISNCESHYRQFDMNGKVFRGEQNHLDVGVMQINEHYHLDTATALGLNLHTTEGNMAYARYLYQHEGTAPWISSSYCWDLNGTKLSHGDQWNTKAVTLASAVRL